MCQNTRALHLPYKRSGSLLKEASNHGHDLKVTPSRVVGLVLQDRLKTSSNLFFLSFFECPLGSASEQSEHQCHGILDAFRF